MQYSTLAALGEFGLIDEIKKMTRVDRSVLLGIGDDTAVIKNFSGKKVLFTTDMLIEGRHFRCSEATGFEIGWKSLG